MRELLSPGTETEEDYKTDAKPANPDAPVARSCFTVSELAARVDEPGCGEAQISQAYSDLEVFMMAISSSTYLESEKRGFQEAAQRVRNHLSRCEISPKDVICD